MLRTATRVISMRSPVRRGDLGLLGLDELHEGRADVAAPEQTDPDHVRCAIAIRCPLLDPSRHAGYGTPHHEPVRRFAPSTTSCTRSEPASSRSLIGRDDLRRRSHAPATSTCRGSTGAGANSWCIARVAASSLKPWPTLVRTRSMHCSTVGITTT